VIFFGRKWTFDAGARPLAMVHVRSKVGREKLEGGMLRYIVVFWQSEQAQDLVEYSLLVAFICLTGAAFFISMGQLTSGIWGVVNTRLAASNNAS
jgi:hypothetical protein